MTLVKESKKNDGYFDKNFDVHMVPIAAGYYAWSKDRHLALSTTLGSCVSVCVCDTHIGVGGMNHFLLPDIPKTQSKNPLDRSERYGEAAIEILLNALYSHGACKNDLTVKIFGGGKVISGVSNDVGKRNVEFARQFFRTERIRITSEDSGGTTGRKVIFYPATGRALVRPVITSTDLTSLAENERKTYEDLRHQKLEGDVELF